MHEHVRARKNSSSEAMIKSMTRSRSARKESRKQQAGSGKAAEKQKAARMTDKRAKGRSKKKILPPSMTVMDNVYSLSTREGGKGKLASRLQSTKNKNAKVKYK